MTTHYFTDAAGQGAQHLGFVPHEELDLSDDELERLKARAKKAVTMDAVHQPRKIPREYAEYLGQTGGESYEDWLGGGYK